MYKYLISFIVAVFVAALFIGQCSSDDYDYDEEEYETTDFPESEPAEINTTQRNIGDAVKVDSHSLSDSEQSTTNIEYNPSGLEIPKLSKSMSEQIVSRKGYTASYNISTKNPNWVAWNLTREHASGSVPRYKGYIDDYEIQGYVPKEEDWYNMPSSLSHGHMCPAGDNKWDEKAMEQTFLLSNMCPQTQKLNSGSWNKLEEKCRDWARRYGSIYIVCGPVYESDSPSTMGTAKIWIPDAFYKVILCMEGTPKAIGFIYANDEQPHNMQQSVRTVDEIETITGIDFFCSLPDDIENSIEAIANFNNW
jgi:endonuclease G